MCNLLGLSFQYFSSDFFFCEIELNITCRWANLRTRDVSMLHVDGQVYVRDVPMLHIDGQVCV